MSEARKYKGKRVSTVLDKILFTKIEALALVRGQSISKCVEFLCSIGVDDQLAAIRKTIKNKDK